jgi:hypothetical protein
MRKVAVASIIAILVTLFAGCAGGEEADETPPLISGVSVSNITDTSATITWTTSEPATSSVKYGIPDSGDYVAISSVTSLELSLSHHVILGELQPLEPDTAYWFRVQSKDASGNEATSEDDTFATLPPSPTSNIQITRIFYDGVVYRVESDEYVEITNLGDVPQDLEGWVLRDISEGYPSFTFPSYILGSGESIRVYTNEIHPEWGGFSFWYSKAVWNNTDPDVAVLYNAEGQEVSRKSY